MRLFGCWHDGVDMPIQATVVSIPNFVCIDVIFIFMLLLVTHPIPAVGEREEAKNDLKPDPLKKISFE